MVRRPTRRMSSRSWVATSTVVPPALISRSRFMISRERSGSRFPVGSSASTRAGSLTSARAMAMLQADPLQHLERAAALLRRGDAEHFEHECDILEDVARGNQLKVQKDEADAAG